MEGSFRSLVTVALTILVAAGGWMFFQNFSIEGWENIKVKPKTPTAATEHETPTTPVAAPNGPARQGDTIKIASFNIQVFGQSKLGKTHVMNLLARVARNFDVIAIQEIRSVQDDVMPRFLELINSEGRHYDYVVGPRLGRSNSKEQYAFIFDRDTIETDRAALYTVEDPDDILHREPLVGWFRTRGPNPSEAFTFSLVNIHTDPDEAQQEVNYLAQAYRMIRDGDGRGEDDVIILGDLNVDDRHLGQLGQISGITWAIAGQPTNVLRTAQYDNLVFHREATREYTGRSGVFDLVREFNIETKEALEISDHMPVWAEFRTIEGGQPGAVAARPKFGTVR